MKYVAFLRGINVGGKTKISMSSLARVLEQAGFTHIQTILNSGNVILESPQRSEGVLKKLIEEIIEETFGFHSDVVISPEENIKQLVQKNPFKTILPTENTRLYVTFFSKPQTTDLPLPYSSKGKDFFIISLSKAEACWYVELSPTYGTTEAMKFLEKTFGKNITTRNWNTVKKIALAGDKL